MENFLRLENVLLVIAVSWSNQIIEYYFNVLKKKDTKIDDVWTQRQQVWEREREKENEEKKKRVRLE